MSELWVCVAICLCHRAKVAASGRRCAGNNVKARTQINFCVARVVELAEFVELLLAVLLVIVVDIMYQRCTPSKGSKVRLPAEQVVGMPSGGISR